MLWLATGVTSFDTLSDAGISANGVGVSTAACALPASLPWLEVVIAFLMALVVPLGCETSTLATSTIGVSFTGEPPPQAESATQEASVVSIGW